MPTLREPHPTIICSELQSQSSETASTPDGVRDERPPNQHDARDQDPNKINNATALRGEQEMLEVNFSLTTSKASVTEKPHLQNLDFGRVELFAPWFPKVDPEYHQAKGFRSWRIWSSKRHIVLWTAFASSTTVLLANIILVAVLGSKYGITSRRGLIKLYEGDCSRVKMYGTGAHVCINILSTLLLGASNLCMQLVVAPTRREIDVAHRKKIWLDIGIPSWRNLRNIDRARRWLFFVLLLSSVPLHFM
jgi:hypothetical protein